MYLHTDIYYSTLPIFSYLTLPYTVLLSLPLHTLILNTGALEVSN